MGLISLFLALIAMLLTLIAFIPLLGWLNWLFIPFSILALVVNIIFHYIDIGFKQAAKAGMMISLVTIAIGIIRLSLGWGIF
jgi:hypothetical protein